MLAQVVLENAAVDLIARHAEVAAHPNFLDIVDRVVAIGAEESESEFAQVPFTQMGLEAKRMAEIVRPNLDGRLTDLMNGFRCESCATFQNRNSGFGQQSPQMQRRSQARKTAPKHEHVNLWCAQGVPSG